MNQQCFQMNQPPFQFLEEKYKLIDSNQSLRHHRVEKHQMNSMKDLNEIAWI